MATIDKYQGDGDERRARSCFYESVNNHIYIGNYGDPHPIIIRVDPITMTKIDRYIDNTLAWGEIQDFAISNPKYLFASLARTPGRALKFSSPSAAGGGSSLPLLSKLLL